MTASALGSGLEETRAGQGSGAGSRRGLGSHRQEELEAETRALARAEHEAKIRLVRDANARNAQRRGARTARTGRLPFSEAKDVVRSNGPALPPLSQRSPRTVTIVWDGPLDNSMGGPSYF